MLKKIHLYVAGTIVLITPAIALAAQQTLGTLITKIVGYLNQALVLLMGVAVVFFVFYVIKYFILPNENRKEAGSYVLFSVLGFFVILAMWGLVNILSNTFGLENNAPTLNTLHNLFPSSGGSNVNTNPVIDSGTVVIPENSNGNVVSGSNDNTQNYNH